MDPQGAAATGPAGQLLARERGAADQAYGSARVRRLAEAAAHRTGDPDQEGPPRRRVRQGQLPPAT